MGNPRKEPWKPCDYEYRDVVALKALADGKATPEQQVRALKWVVEKAGGLYEEHYYSGVDGERNTSFALGRAFAGRSVVKLVNMPGSIMEELRKKEEKHVHHSNSEQG